MLYPQPAIPNHVIGEAQETVVGKTLELILDEPQHG